MYAKRAFVHWYVGEGMEEGEFMIKSSPSFCNGGCVAQHANSSWDFGQVASWDNCGWLVIYANFESCGTPVNELNRSLGLDCTNGGINILWNHIASVQHTACHVFSMTRITFDHLVCRLETCICYFRYAKLLMISFFSRDDRRIRH